MLRLAICLFLSSFSLLFASESWTHLELGAGNYGRHGEQSLQNVNFYFYPEIQFKLLFWTVDELILRYGPNGIIFLNDIKEEHIDYTIEKLSEYLASQGYDRITLEKAPGDYFTSDFSIYLEKYGETLYDSVHLKNPEAKFFMGRKKNQSEFTEARAKGRDSLQRLADFSKTGLFFFTLYHGLFFPEIEKEEYVDKGIFYLPTDEWPDVDYYYPSGALITDGRTFFIQSHNGL